MIVAHSYPTTGWSSTAVAEPPVYRVLALPAFADNYLWLLHDRNGAAVAVDPGDAAPVLAALQDLDLRLCAILLTHHHADHVGGVAALARGSIPVYGPDDPRVPATDRVVQGDRVQPDWQGGTFDVLEVPGHTRSHLAYRIGDDLFCGDALFVLGCGRLFEGSPAQAWSSLQRLASLPGSTRIHCAHEYTLDNLRFAQSVFPDDAELHALGVQLHAQRARGEPTVPGSMAIERRCNPFLRMADRHWREHLGNPTLLNDATAAFAELRRRKDHFR